jgi:hypothetical protein
MVRIKPLTKTQDRTKKITKAESWAMVMWETEHLPIVMRP